MPGNPVSKNEVEEYLGMINGKSSRTKEKMLQQNGIKTRHYAIDKNQKTTISIEAQTEMQVDMFTEMSEEEIAKQQAAISCSLDNPDSCEMCSG